MIAVSVKPCIVMCILPDAGAISTSAEFLSNKINRYITLVNVNALAKARTYSHSVEIALAYTFVP